MNQVESIRAAMPAEGLFAEKDWLVSPSAFPITAKFADELTQLGHQLFVFQRACNQLYYLSVRGKQPAWVARYLDVGKPKELVEFARQKGLREQLPAIIRPDLILTDAGYTIAEIDSVPGGIGLTAWFNKTYAALGEDVVGGSGEMIAGFQRMLPEGADILVSNESGTYRPEMKWLAKELNALSGAGESEHKKVKPPATASNERGSYKVVEAENYSPQPGRDVYRFFEMFDLANIPGIEATLAAAGRGDLRMTPPPKPFLEEKMWFALFWLQPLREYWRRELGEKYFFQLQQVIPYTWLLDPTELPQHAVIPRLEIQDWREARKFSQKNRELMLKVSGFSPLGWGSRGVALGSDLPQAEWEKQIDDALAHFAEQPKLMQRFHKGRQVEHPFFDSASAEMRTMKGRARLCPYYFVEGNKVKLHGILTTIVPADKKMIHGMRDGILVPTAITRD